MDCEGKKREKIKRAFLSAHVCMCVFVFYICTFRSYFYRFVLLACDWRRWVSGFRSSSQVPGFFFGWSYEVQFETQRPNATVLYSFYGCIYTIITLRYLILTV